MAASFGKMEETGTSEIQFLQEIDTTLYADSVEWCPIENYHQFLVCGTYQLQDDKKEIQTRLGSIHLYQLYNTTSLKLIHQIEGPGILDIKWQNNSSCKNPTGCLVDAEGQVQVFELKKTDEHSSLTILETIANLKVQENGLTLSLEWDGLSQNRVVTSTSLGNIAVVDVGSKGLSLGSKWKAHEYEAWTCAFDAGNANVVYSGGDDCKFKSWDLRTDLSKPISSLSEHDMGVTNISPNPLKHHLLCTGSYDERIVLWDCRLLKKPVKDVVVGGGVWRIKWDPRGSNHVAVAAMHNGVHVLCLDDDKISTFDRHKSMAYGVDWNRDVSKENDQRLLTSCSFYDHSLQLWNWKRKKDW